MRRSLRQTIGLLCVIPLVSFLHANLLAESGPKFAVSFAQPVHAEPITGRVFLLFSTKADPEVRLQFADSDDVPIFGIDVDQLRPGQAAVIDSTTLGYPAKSLKDLPAGDYYVQALMNVYTEFHRSDGHTIWAHMDQWEGQQFNLSPGNLISKVQKVHFDPTKSQKIELSLTEVIPPIEVPADTEWVKHIKIQSKMLTEFWGRPIYLGAVVLLPRDYASHPEMSYPAVYEQGHFNLEPPFGFSTEDKPLTEQERNQSESLNLEPGYEFYRSWNSDQFPRMIAVTFQHPTPYYDNSFALNSVNTGPYGDALVKELIPYLESHFRIIQQPYARVVTGCSAGGQESLALQIKYPEFFGGVWSICPAEIDFRSYYSLDLYKLDNAFVRRLREGGPAKEWVMVRDIDGQPTSTVREWANMEAILGTKGRGDFWFDPSSATYGPVGPDGYPQCVFDKETGVIDHKVTQYWKDSDHDLREYTERNWKTIGPQLVGKIHFYVGDMDEFYGATGVYLWEDFLTHTHDPYYGGYIEYGRPRKAHGWQPVTNAGLMKVIAEHIATNAPSGANLDWKQQ